ncbi:hypothetical protein GCM10022410_16850 [Amphibacillus indicireducens]|uniref:Uncharacterized protein n=1 Tax=Amphibacillus indicireducens TaxID=1076330 RepID=A0ABP7VS61_9BACI
MLLDDQPDQQDTVLKIMLKGAHVNMETLFFGLLLIFFKKLYRSVSMNESFFY